MLEAERQCGYSLTENNDHGIGYPVTDCPEPYSDPVLKEIATRHVSPATEAMEGQETSYGDYDPREAAVQAQNR